jgi:pimeloyl-ACP methyl ester carboxylesterase
MALIEGVDVEHCGSGPDLVILHSLLAERSAFDRVVPALSKKRRVWLVNLPGYGPRARRHGWTADRIAALLPANRKPMYWATLRRLHRGGARRPARAAPAA